MDRSWFSKASSSKYGLLSSPPSSSQHELPRWRSPSPSMAASMIPPPIVQSTYAAASNPSASMLSSVAQSTSVPQHSTLHLPARGPRPTPLQHRQNELEADLQYLLDAQAAALIKAVDGGATEPTDGQSSTGSTTPTAQSVRSAATWQSSKRRSQPVRRTIGLKGARRGIYKSIVALAEVKSDELHTLDSEAQAKAQTLAQIAEWEHKRNGLKDAARATGEDDENVRAQRLRSEADGLQVEINQVEMQLMDLKARQRKLLRQAGAAENAVQAKLASYTSALGMLEGDIQKFLSRKPVSRQDVRPVSRDGKASVWNLPAPHRTLEMARGQLAEEKEAVEEQQRGVEREKKALDEGATMWKHVTGQVTAFETKVATEMALLGSEASHNERSAWEEDDDVSKDLAPEAQSEPNDRLRGLLVDLSTVLEEVNTQYKLAETRDWKLLIAAIGAELDALRKGKAILQGLLGINVEDEHDSSATAAMNGLLDDDIGGELSRSVTGNTDNESSGNEIHNLDERFGGDVMRNSLVDKGKGRAMDHVDDEEDPDPELLFSTHGEE